MQRLGEVNLSGGAALTLATVMVGPPGSLLDSARLSTMLGIWLAEGDLS